MKLPPGGIPDYGIFTGLNKVVKSKRLGNRTGELLPRRMQIIEPGS
jgi:hypothetical protein